MLYIFHFGVSWVSAYINSKKNKAMAQKLEAKLRLRMFWLICHGTGLKLSVCLESANVIM